jgi:hypothetical protein
MREASSDTLDQVVIFHPVNPVMRFNHVTPPQMVEVTMVNPGALHQTTRTCAPNRAIISDLSYTAPPKRDAREPE